MFNEQLLAGRRILVTAAEPARQIDGRALPRTRRRGSYLRPPKGRLRRNRDRIDGPLWRQGDEPRVDIRNPLAVDEMIETIFTEGPLTDLINNAAGNFVSRTQDLTPAASMRSPTSSCMAHSM